MSHDKAIENGKEHRKPYYGSQAIDRSCRPGGDCPRCERARKHKEARQQPVEDPEEGGE